MPVGFSSAARNLFLLGASGADSVTNFFLELDKSSTGYTQWRPQGIHYNASDQTYINLLQTASSGYDLTLEKVQQDGTIDWTSNAFNTNNTNNSSLSVTSLHVDSNGDILAAGQVGSPDNQPVVLKYTNGGSLTWSSTTSSANVTYQSLTSDSNNNYYACGHTPSTGFNNDSVAFVEKFDVNGNPGWGKSAFMLGRNVKLSDIAANSRGEVVAVGSLEDDSNDKGYIVKIDTGTGSVLWDRTLDFIGTQDIFIYEVFIDNNDQIYVAGQVGGFGEAFLIKYTPEGNIIWQKQTQAMESGTYGKYFRPVGLRSDGETEQTVVLHDVFDVDLAFETGEEMENYLSLSKYSKDGSLVWRRNIQKNSNDSIYYGNLDADPSFYYTNFKKFSSGHNKYIFGKVSTSGNGLGDFSYDDGSTDDIEYTISDVTDTIGRLTDGSVRNDTSDLVAYPFSANKIVFDDLATHVSNKRRQMDSADSFEYSGSPAIRPADFQELNLLGENVSDRIWTDTSGKGNNGVASLTEPFFGAGSVSFDGTGDSISVGPLLPTSTGTAFTVDMFWRSTSNTVQTCLWEQHNSGSGRTAYFINGTNAFLISEGNTVGSFAYSDNVWYFTRVTYTAGGEIEVFVNGVSRGTGTQTVGVDNVNFVIGDRSGVNESFNGYISNCRVVVDSALNGTEVPTTPLTAITGTELLTCQGDTIADASANNFTITVNGNAAPTDDGPTHNAAGYWEFDGVDDVIIVNNPNLHYEEMSFDWWLWNDTTQSINTYIGKRDNTNNGYMIFRWSGGTLYFDYGGSGNRWNTSWVVPNTQWVHCVLTRDSNGRKLYVNGVEEATTSNAGSYITSTLGVGIGDTSSADVYYTDGRIGEVRVYPKALTAAQVFQNYNATKTKYINEAPDTAPKISDSAIVYDSNLLLNYDFGNRATYDRAENLLKYSEQVDGLNYTNPDWGRNGSIDFEYPTDILSPLGTSGVSKFTRTGGGTVYVAQDSFATLEAGKQYTFSMYIKKGTSGKFRMELGDGGDNILTAFDIDTLLFSGTSATQDFASLDETGYTDLGNGWYRIWITGTVSASPSGGIFAGDGLTNVAIYFNADNVGEYGYVWGAQVNQGGIGRYIKTTISPITAPTTVKNLSSSSYTGTLNGATFNSAGYFEFDGTNDDITTAYTSALDEPQSFTYEVWVNAADVVQSNNFPRIFDKGGTGVLAHITTNSPFSLAFNINTGSSLRQVQTSINGDQWYHITMKYDGQIGSIYLNGTGVASTDFGSVVQANTPTAGITLGNTPNIGRELQGSIGEFRYYNRELTAAEISQNFNATRGKYGV